MNSGDFAAIAVTLYFGHHVGDYWVQRHADALHKGDLGVKGIVHCLNHVTSYIATQLVGLLVVLPMVHKSLTWYSIFIGLLVSGVTHYIADRRKPLERIASWMPWKRDFVKLGMPRELPRRCTCATDNPQLATGLWALDQSWHIFWGVFVTALVMVTL